MSTIPAGIGTSINDSSLENLAIIDAMAILQSVNKSSQIKKMKGFRETFLKKIGKRTEEYNEVNVIFDEYIENSLKYKTRATRVTCKAAAEVHYRINDNMSLASIILKNFPSSTKTKQSLTAYLADDLLKHFRKK